MKKEKEFQKKTFLNLIQQKEPQAIKMHNPKFQIFTHYTLYENTNLQKILENLDHTQELFVGSL